MTSIQVGLLIFLLLAAMIVLVLIKALPHFRTDKMGEESTAAEASKATSSRSATSVCFGACVRRLLLRLLAAIARRSKPIEF